MEGEEGPLRQELFEDLADFSTPFGEPASADTVSTFLALPEGRNYDAQLPLGLWRDSGSAGALECIKLPLENRADDRPPRRCRPPSPPRNGERGSGLARGNGGGARRGDRSRLIREANDRGIALARGSLLQARGRTKAQIRDTASSPGRSPADPR